MAKLGFLRCCFWVVGSFALFLPPSARAQIEASHELSVGMGVWGIVRYTRWPRPPQPLKFCFVGENNNRNVITQTAESAAPEYSSIFVEKHIEDDFLTCDVVYAGQLTQEKRKKLIRKLQGRPILHIGEGKEYCSSGGMFCLEEGSRFAANLDAISRSALRVNPQVLRLFIRLKELN